MLLLHIISCKNERKTLFTSLPSSRTGISFSNTITESDSLNIFRFEYIYNGGGLGAGDLNGDGLVDLYFAGNMLSSKLYLNKGNMKFNDVTLISQTSTKSWCTGVAMVDINQDGRLDIYVTTAHPPGKAATPNLLFINKGNDENGIPVFNEVAKSVGLDNAAYGTQAVFFDYDLDGDLDMYLCNNADKEGNRNALIPISRDGKSASEDKLYKNDGISEHTKLPSFTDVSRTAGILGAGWGLGVITKDINRDGWPDIYVSNDFVSNDHLYINNKNGTFTDKIGQYLAHESQNAMGIDIADCNNDGLEDICVVDMLPNDNLRQKTMFGSIPNDTYRQSVKMGYQPQFVRNMLQLNTGLIPSSTNHGFAFSDIGYLAGVAATDWSWSSLWADLDNDGWRDLLITNGYVKDITDMDFTSYLNEYSVFGDPNVKRAATEKKTRELGEVKKANFLFLNNHHIGFTDIAKDAGLLEKTFTNGTIYADLDNDGDLDVVMNNINDEALIYRNNTNIKQNHFLTVTLHGNKGNREGIGAKVTIWYNGQMQVAEQTMQRGYMSSMDGRIYFGLGSSTRVDSIFIQWPCGVSEKKANIHANSFVALKEHDAKPNNITSKVETSTSFTDVTAKMRLDGFLHKENEFEDFNYQFSLPHRYSLQGPALAVSDVNGDGLDDVYIGGSSRNSGSFLIQGKNGFRIKPSLKNAAKKPEEETGVLLFDADNDGDRDLYCVSGGNEFNDDTHYQDLFLLNDGKGNFTEDKIALPNTTSSGTCVIGADFDLDGDIDLFVGGSIKANQYPLSGRSYLLRNDFDKKTGRNHFTDVTSLYCKNLVNPGIVNAALWTDYDNDGYPDIILTGEFMPITLFRNLKGKSFIRANVPAFFHSNGWYNSLCAGDFDNDGDIDYVAGNLGLNTPYKATFKEPVSIRFKDFNNDGSLDAFLFRYYDHVEYPAQPRSVFTEQIPALRKRIYYYHDFGKATFTSLFNYSERKGVSELQAFQMASIFIENKGNGVFLITQLPILAQTSPMFGITAMDVNGDNYLDIVAVGNSYASEALTGRYDASNGWILRNAGGNKFSFESPANTGFTISGDAKSLIKFRNYKDQPVLLIGRNQGPLTALKLTKPVKKCISLKDHESYVMYSFSNGRKRKEEFYYGNSYLSASGRFLLIDSSVKKLSIYGSSGITREFKF